MLLLCIEKCHSGAWSVAAVANCGAVFRRLGFVAFERSRQHALRGAAPASPATETQGHGPGLHPARGDERPRRASRQRQGPRALLEAPLMARRNPAHKRQRCLRPSALGDVCLHDARFGPSAILTALPRLQNSPLAKCGSKKFCMDFHGDHPSTCTAHSGATKAHDWMVSVLGPLFRTAGHVVRTQQGVTASAGQRRGDVEIRNYLRDQAGRRSLVFDLSIAHDRFGSSSHPQQNRSLTHPQDIDAPLRVAAQRDVTPHKHVGRIEHHDRCL